MKDFNKVRIAIASPAKIREWSFGEVETSRARERARTNMEVLPIGAVWLGPDSPIRAGLPLVPPPGLDRSGSACAGRATLWSEA